MLKYLDDILGSPSFAPRPILNVWLVLFDTTIASMVLGQFKVLIAFITIANSYKINYCLHILIYK